MTMQRAQALSLLALSLAATLALAPGCGDDSADGAGGSTPTCGTTADPELLTVTERSPEAESLVANDAIVHRFRIVGAPGIIQNMQFELPAAHTAGAPTPAELLFTITQEGSDLVYEAAPLTWANAPGRVEMRIAGSFQTDDGCVYAFPAPLFAYDLDESGEGGGGVGGSGVGGSGAGGGGEGARAAAAEHERRVRAAESLELRDRVADVVGRTWWSLALTCLAAACGGGSATAVEAPTGAGAASSAVPRGVAALASSEAAGSADPAPAETAAPKLDWREHDVVGFAGKMRARVFASDAPSVEQEREADAEGSARATLKIPIGEKRPIDCHLRAARLSAVEAVAGVAKLVAKHRATAIQASVSHVDERLVLRYALDVDEPNGGARVGTIRVAMAIGESDTAMCSHLGGDDGTAFEGSTASLFRGLRGIAEKPADYVDVVWVHSTTQGGSPLDVEHRLRARTPAAGGPAEELGVSLTASIEKGELLVTETVSGLRLDATNEVTEATIATRDNRGSAVDVGVVRRAPKSYVMRVLVGGRDQMAPVATSSPLTTELSLTPKIAAARRAHGSGKAELRWTELLPVGLGREVSVIQTRRLVAVPGGVDLHVEGSEPARWGCTADDVGALLLCQLRAQSSLLTRSRAYLRP